MNHHHPSDDLLLQATRYVLEEMDATERDQFEQLLLEDQPAREAVASAVELLVATQVAKVAIEDRPTPRHSASRPTTGHPRRLVWWISAAAACLLVAMVALLQSRPRQPQGDIAHISPETPEFREEQGKGLAQVWARSLDDDPERETNGRGLWWDLEIAADLTEVGPRFDGEELDDELTLGPPSWMLTALAAQQEQGIPATGIPATGMTEQREESRQ